MKKLDLDSIGRDPWRWRLDFVLLGACVGLGLTMALLPAVAGWMRSGEPAYFADHDEASLYLPIAAVAAREGLSYVPDLGGPVGSVSFYPWIQIMPGVLVARALGLGPASIGLIWRAMAALSITCAWYGTLRWISGRAWAAAIGTALLLTDCGLRFGTPLVRQFAVALQWLRGTDGPLFASYPMVHVQWRLITPGLSMAYLIAALGAIIWARSRGDRRAVAVAGLAIGLNFYAYFYYWTALGLALGLAIVVDWPRAKVYFRSGLLGLLVGLPAVAINAGIQRSMSPDTLPRNDFFLPIEPTSELLFPRAAIGLTLLLAPWVYFRRRDLAIVWCLAAAGLILSNHQLITGLQIQNHHYGFATGAALSLLVVSGLANLLGRGPAWRPWAAGGAALLFVALGLWLRWQEATRTAESVALLESYERYREQRLSPGVAPLPPRGVVGGDRRFVDFAICFEDIRPLDSYVIEVSGAVSDREHDRRIALQAWLAGKARAEFRRDTAAWLDGATWGWWAASRVAPEGRTRRESQRLAAFEQIVADPGAALDEFGVVALARPVGQPVPSLVAEGWDRIQSGPHWDLWTRPPGAGAPARPPDAGDPQRR